MIAFTAASSATVVDVNAGFIADLEVIASNLVDGLSARFTTATKCLDAAVGAGAG